MAGFAVLVAPDLPPELLEKEFVTLLQLTARYKQLAIQPSIAKGTHCMAAKLDSDATIHPGIVRDDQTGSWILAAGTVVALEGNNNPNTLLIHLLQDYIARGNIALEAYDGQFALVIYNGREESLSVVSDAIGMFGIFYTQRGSRLLISSSALAIATQTISLPDVLAIEHFLRTGRLDADKTLWQDVKRLFAATVLKVTDSRIKKNEYWSPTFDMSVSRLPMFEALDQSVDLLSHTFSRTLQRERKVWVDLTGGFDTRLAAMFVAKLKIPFSTYCMGPGDHPDVQLSRKIGEEMGWEHVHTQLPEQWEPYQYSWFDNALGCGDGQVSVLRLACTLRGFMERNATIKTNVMGVGGENWRGFYWTIEKGNIGRTSTINYKALLDDVFSFPIPLHVMQQDHTREVRLELSDFAHQLCSIYAEYPNTVQLDRFQIYRDAGHGGAYLSAAASIGRSLAPLCFKALVNFAFSLNYHWKYPFHHIFVRALLERENKPLSTIATTTGGPALPIRLSNVHKFWPLWKKIANRAVVIGSKEVLGKPLQLMAEPLKTAYPLPAWRKAFLLYAGSKKNIDYDRMCTAGLYNREEFINLITRVEQDPNSGSEFIDRIITVEMTMRATGSHID